MRLHTLGITGLTCLSLFTSVAVADPAYDCWIGNSAGKYTMQYIRCIADRPDGTPSEDDDLIVQLMDAIHYEVHWGDTAQAEAIVRSNPLLGMSGLVNSIRLYSYPHEWSWDEGNPQRLVRASLCSKTMDCGVEIRRD